jgi:transposase
MKWLASIATSWRIIVAQEKTRSRRKRRRPAVEHIAIDLGGRESQICIRSSDGTIVEELRRHTGGLKSYLGTRPTSRVILETCAEGFAIADAALELGHEVRVVPATLVRSLGVGARHIKTDRRDAQLLSEVSCRIDLPSVHVPTAQSRERKTICGMRDALVGSRTKLINNVRGWLRTSLRRVSTGAAESFPTRVRKHFAERNPAPIPRFAERQLEMIDSLSAQIREAEREVAQLAKRDPICVRLMTVPGVGPTTAIRYVAALDDIGRFGSAHRVASYLGLTPGEDSSCDRKRRLAITKAGSAALRWTLNQAAWGARRCRRRDPLHDWVDGIEKRRGKKIAITALSRKLAGIMYAIWRDGTVYSPLRSARAA